MMRGRESISGAKVLRAIRVMGSVAFLLAFLLAMNWLISSAAGMRESPTGAPAPTVTASDPTAGWKVYVDTNNAFTVKYPDGWTIENSDVDQPHWVAFYSRDFKESDVALESGGKVTIYIDRRDYYPRSLSDIGKVQGGDSDTPIVVAEKPIVVDGTTGTSRFLTQVLGSGKENVLMKVWVPKDDKMYIYLCDHTRSSSTSIARACELMLQTLRFTSP